MQTATSSGTSDTEADFDPRTIVEGIRNGDSEMEATFCCHYYIPVLRLLQGYMRDPSRAEDITHEVLIRVLVRLREGTIDHPDRLTNFVQQTARYSFIGWTRQYDNKVTLMPTLDDQPATNDTEHPVFEDEQRSLVLALINSLDVPRDREVLYRSYMCDEPKQTICESLTLSTIHFDRVISRARGRLRQIALDHDFDVEAVLA